MPLSPGSALSQQECDMYRVPAGSTWGIPAAPSAPALLLPRQVEDAQPRGGEGAALFPSTTVFKTSSFLMEILTDWEKVARKIIEQLDIQSLSRLVQTHCRKRSADAEFEDWGEGKLLVWKSWPSLVAWISLNLAKKEYPGMLRDGWSSLYDAAQIMTLNRRADRGWQSSDSSGSEGVENMIQMGRMRGAIRNCSCEKEVLRQEAEDEGEEYDSDYENSLPMADRRIIEDSYVEHSYECERRWETGIRDAFAPDPEDTITSPSDHSEFMLAFDMQVGGKASSIGKQKHEYALLSALLPITVEDDIVKMTTGPAILRHDMDEQKLRSYGQDAMSAEIRICRYCSPEARQTWQDRPIGTFRIGKFCGRRTSDQMPTEFSVAGMCSYEHQAADWWYGSDVKFAFTVSEDPEFCNLQWGVGSRGKKIEPEVIVKFQRAPNSKPFVNIKLHYVYEPSYEAYSESGPGYGDNIESFPLKWSTLAPRMERLEFHEVKFDET